MTAPVVTATPTVCDGLVIRWRRSLHAPDILSASRRAIMVHGDVTVDDDLEQWIGDAIRARDLLRVGRDDEARTLATHLLSRELVPIETTPA